MSDLEAILETATKRVCSTMLNYEVEFNSLEGDFFDGKEHVAGAVAITGVYNGVINVYSDAALARHITCCVLRMSDHEIEGNEMVNDVIGELSNMIVGHLKSTMESKVGACAMTTPKVVRGSNFSALPAMGVVRKTVNFPFPNGKILVEACPRRTI